MTARVVDTDAGLAALVPEWKALWRRCGAGPFQSPAWLVPWWGAFGNGAPRVATCWEAGRLMGVLPFYLYEGRLLPMGAGNTDVLDVLGDGAGPMVAALLAGGADVELLEVPEGSALLVVSAEWRACGVRPCLRLQASGNGGGPTPGPSLTQGGGMARKLRMSRHRAERAGGWAVEIADAAALPAALERLVALHQARWQAGGEAGVLCDPAVLAFHRAAAPGLLAAGVLRLASLRVGGEVVAVVMALLGPGRISFYLGGYDLAHAFVSPGTLLVGALLEQAAAEGRTEADFLRGQEAYKYAWGAVDQPNHACRLTPGHAPCR